MPLADWLSSSVSSVFGVCSAVSSTVIHRFWPWFISMPRQAFAGVVLGEIHTQVYFGSWRSLTPKHYVSRDNNIVGFPRPRSSCYAFCNVMHQQGRKEHTHTHTELEMSALKNRDRNVMFQLTKAYDAYTYLIKVRVSLFSIKLVLVVWVLYCH